MQCIWCSLSASCSQLDEILRLWGINNAEKWLIFSPLPTSQYCCPLERTVLDRNGLIGLMIFWTNQNNKMLEIYSHCLPFPQSWNWIYTQKPLSLLSSHLLTLNCVKTFLCIVGRVFKGLRRQINPVLRL
jgi:hypothetical protein